LLIPLSPTGFSTTNSFVFSCAHPNAAFPLRESRCDSGNYGKGWGSGGIEPFISLAALPDPFRETPISSEEISISLKGIYESFYKISISLGRIGKSETEIHISLGGIYKSKRDSCSSWRGETALDILDSRSISPVGGSLNRCPAR